MGRHLCKATLITQNKFSFGVTKGATIGATTTALTLIKSLY